MGMVELASYYLKIDSQTFVSFLDSMINKNTLSDIFILVFFISFRANGILHYQ